MSESFEGKVAVVTGGASGIGRAAAELISARGGCVLIADIDGRAAQAVADGVARGAAISCDVTDPDAVASAVTTAVDVFGGLDILVNNAGIPLTRPLVEVEPGEIQRVINTNFTSVVYGIKFAAPHIAQRGGGSIVSTSSTGGLRGMAASGIYAASKAAVINLTKTAALELRPLGIRVNCVLPGFIDTPILQGQLADFDALSPVSISDMVQAKQGRMGRPEDIARAIAYLASDEAEFISGIALPADNAMSASLF